MPRPKSDKKHYTFMLSVADSEALDTIASLYNCANRTEALRETIRSESARILLNQPDPKPIQIHPDDLGHVIYVGPV